MHVSGFPLVIKRVFALIFFRIARGFVVLGQAILWTFTGTRRSIRDSVLAENYNKSVQVMSIRGRFLVDVLKGFEMTDLLLFHERFESPQYIFDSDHVTLMTMNDDVAVFIEALPGQELWRSEFNSFIRLAQFAYAKRVLLVPLPVFHRMSEELGDPRHPLIYLFNSARCGSTLLTQMMEYSGKVVSISEPDLLTTVSTWYHERGDNPQIRQRARDSIRWICRPYRAIDPELYVVKLMGPAVIGLPLFHELFPASKCLFMYRGVEKTAKSLHRMAQELPSLVLILKLGKISGYFVELFINSIGMVGKLYRMRLEDDIDFGIIVWMVICREYLILRQSGFKVDAIRYEDLVKDKRDTTLTILEYCGLSADLVDSALKGLEVDSQRNSPISIAIIGRHPEPPMTDRARDKFNVMLRQYNMPLIGDPNDVLEGTITGTHVK